MEGGWAKADRGGLPIRVIHHQPVDPGEWFGGVEALQRAGRSGEPDQGTGGQFGNKRLCVENFRGTEALHHPAILEKNLWALLQKGLGLLQICQLNTLRLRRLSWGREPGNEHMDPASI
jgi:hypothetical protein